MLSLLFLSLLLYCYMYVICFDITFAILGAISVDIAVVVFGCYICVVSPAAAAASDTFSCSLTSCSRYWFCRWLIIFNWVSVNDVTSRSPPPGKLGSDIPSRTQAISLSSFLTPPLLFLLLFFFLLFLEFPFIFLFAFPDFQFLLFRLLFLLFFFFLLLLLIFSPTSSPLSICSSTFSSQEIDERTEGRWMACSRFLLAVLTCIAPLLLLVHHWFYLRIRTTCAWWSREQHPD